MKHFIDTRVLENYVFKSSKIGNIIDAALLDFKVAH